MQQSGATSRSAQGGSPSAAAEEVYQFPSFPEMPRMPEKPDYPWLHTSEQGATHAPHQNAQSALPLHDRPVDPEGAIESSHVTLDSTKLPASSALKDDPLLTGIPPASRRSPAGAAPPADSTALAHGAADASSTESSQAAASGNRAAQKPDVGRTAPSSKTGSSAATSNAAAGNTIQQPFPGAQPQAAPSAERQTDASSEQASPAAHSTPGAAAAGAAGIAGAGAAVGALGQRDAPESSTTQPNGLQPTSNSSFTSQRNGVDQHSNTSGVPGDAVSQSEQQTGHSGQPATGSGHAQTTVNPVSDTATEIAGGSAGDVSGAPRSDEAMIPAGPYLQFLGYDVATTQWHGSLAVVIPPLGPEGAREPVLTFTHKGRDYPAEGRILEHIEGWAFWRFDFDLRLDDQEHRVDYVIQLPKHYPERNVMRDSFAVPSIEQQWHWGFHSCNGLSVNSDREKWGTPHLWQDVLNTHARQPLHALVGGGDQIYNDAVWKCPSLTQWLDISHMEERYQHHFTDQMFQEATAFYFNHYREHFSTPLIAEVMARIPQVMVWDDHDIWDGWGSYPERLQTCPVFIGLYLVSRRAYLLFQHHTTDERAHQDNDMFGPPSTYSFIRMFGPKTACLCLDSRSERTVKQVMSPAFYKALYPRLEQLPKTTEHIVCVHTVPLVFPSLPLSEGVMTVIEGSKVLKSAMTKTGVGAGIIDKFGHAELLDDITDHWDSSAHKQERAQFIMGMQGIAKLRNVRVSFLGGDVHVCAVGRFYTSPKVRHLRNDYRFMPQITSSAAWNNPPPDALVKLLHATNRASKVCHHTREKMVRLFQEDHPKADKVLARRNWLEITPVQSAPDIPDGWRVEKGALVMTLRVEDPENQKATPAAYPTLVPAYIPDPKGMRPRLQHKTWPQRLGCTSTPASVDHLEEL